MIIKPKPTHQMIKDQSLLVKPFCQDLANSNWSQAIKNIQDSEESKISNMVELLFSKLMEADGWKELVTQHVQLLQSLQFTAENVSMPEALAESLDLLDKVIHQKKMENEDTFDGLLETVEKSKDSVLLRVIFNEGLQKSSLITSLQSANSSLQTRFQKGLKLAALCERAKDSSPAECIACIQEALTLNISIEDMDQSPAVGTDFSILCKAFADVSLNTFHKCVALLQPIFEGLQKDHELAAEDFGAEDLKSAVALFNTWKNEAVLQLLKKAPKFTLDTTVAKKMEAMSFVASCR